MNPYLTLKYKIIISLSLALAGLFLFVQPALADGIVIPDRCFQKALQVVWIGGYGNLETRKLCDN